MTAAPAIDYIQPFKPLKWQYEPWRSKAFTLLLTGSAGGGKSRLAGEKIHAMMLKYPGSTGLFMRKTRESITNSTVMFMDRLIIGNDPQVRHYSSKNRFEYDNGSVLAYGGMKNDEQREQIRSIGKDGSLDVVWMEEATAFTEDDYNEVLARLRGTNVPWNQLIMSTNPDAPSHWINQRLIKGGEAAVFYSSATDNPHNPPSYIDTLNRLTGVLGKRLRDGLWVQAEGAVYPTFDPAIHVVDWFEPPADWERFCFIDYGYTNPFVCQWWARDPDGRLYLYREIYKTKTIINEHASRIKELEGWYARPDDLTEGQLESLPKKIRLDDAGFVLDSEGRRVSNENRESITARISDHDAEERGTMEAEGLPTVKAKKDVSLGIQAVTDRLAVQGDDKPRLFLMRGAVDEIDSNLVEQRKPASTLEEIDGYVWQKATSGKPVKEAPVKENDHGMDAMRYGVLYLDGSPEIWTIKNPFYD